MYSAIISLKDDNSSKNNGVTPVEMTKYQILMQMINEDDKDEKASRKKDPRMKVF
jgi:hypothetical protein